MIILGSTVRCRITGFTGIVTGKVEYITGCNQSLVQPTVGNDGNYRDSIWLDADKLEQVGDWVINLKVDNAGFDKAPPRR